MGQRRRWPCPPVRHAWTRATHACNLNATSMQTSMPPPCKPLHANLHAGGVWGTAGIDGLNIDLHHSKSKEDIAVTSVTLDNEVKEDVLLMKVRLAWAHGVLRRMAAWAHGCMHACIRRDEPLSLSPARLSASHLLPRYLVSQRAHGHATSPPTSSPSLSSPTLPLSSPSLLQPCLSGRCRGLGVGRHEGSWGAAEEIRRLKYHHGVLARCAPFRASTWGYEDSLGSWEGEAWGVHAGCMR